MNPVTYKRKYEENKIKIIEKKLINYNKELQY